MGLPFQSDPASKYYITQEILNEIMHIKRTIDGLNLLISLGKVVIKDVLPENIFYMVKKIKSKGQFGLSKPDCSLLALSFQINLPIISTDYALINMARHLSLEAIVPGKNNFHTLNTRKYCSICKKFFNIKFLYCNFCGNKLVFKNYKS